MTRTGARPLPDPLEAVLFDLDGTLVAIGAPGASGAVARSRGAELMRRVWVSTETPLNHAIALVERVGLARVATPAVRWARHLKGVSSEAETRLLGDAREVVARLSRRARVAVVTSRSRPAARAILERHGLDAFVSLVVTRSDVWRLKPHPAAILAALAQLGCAAHEAVIVGDMPVDVRAGRRAGVFSLGVTSGLATEAELFAAGADRVVPTVREIERLLCEAPGART